MSTAVVALALAIFSSCNEGSSPPIQGTANTVTWADVLAFPEKYDGHLVRLTGWCRVEFEGTALYATRGAFEGRDASNALWLTLGWPASPEMLALDGQKVVVEGRLNGSLRGHLNAFRASLLDIQRIEPNTISSRNVVAGDGRRGVSPSPGSDSAAGLIASIARSDRRTAR